TRLSGMSRPDGRSPDQLREIRMTRGWLEHAEGSVLIEFGATRVLCAASATEEVPRWRRGSGLGWGTAEYAMLPRATNTRGGRERPTPAATASRSRAGWAAAPRRSPGWSAGRCAPA